MLCYVDGGSGLLIYVINIVIDPGRGNVLDSAITPGMQHEGRKPGAAGVM